jgi:hypothetical protein
VAGLVVLALHAALVSWWPLGVGAGRSGGVSPVVSVRQIVQARPSVEAETLPADAAAPAAEAAPAEPAADARPARPGSAAPDPARGARAEAAAAPATSAVAAAPGAPRPEAAASAAEGARANAVPAGGGLPVPTYATRVPRAVVLQFELRRNGLVESGELVWSPSETGYAATFNGRAFGRPVLSWASQGRFDTDGLAPERFTVENRRAVHAANFQREKGHISYSGQALEHPLAPGAQDRLSWMLQLPAIIAADPAAFGPGTSVSMQVTGARGDADVWTFAVEARETVDVVEGRIENALRLLREPRRPYDTRVAVWLDPARQHLPVKLSLVQAHSGEAFEFSLRSLVPGQ